ncbi:MAG: AbrB/MazE/SpoVT family DNA-binding domain-containing protein [Candidatus Riflebacteria bacterium]|nr:AbrB/MazE/SpoVT family DNA-binding domain-containing protein [Candidatus Riflebacteria bacterium]
MKENIVLKVDEKGRLTFPLKMRKDYHIEPGDVFFVKPEQTGIHLAKVENPFDVLAEYALHEYKEGNTMELRAFAKKNNIKIKK